MVFEKAQTLPRFWIELAVDFPNVAISELANAGELLTILFSLLDKKEIQSYVALSEVLQSNVDEMLELSETTPLKSEDQKLLKLVKRLMPEGQSLSPSVINTLLKSVAVNSTTLALSPLKESLSAQNPPALFVSSLAPALPLALAKPILPAIAFGAAEWKKYIGDVDIEPPLPANIDQILAAQCPFWPSKKVGETHLLVLIPQTVNGKPLNLKFLGELVQKPLQGKATKYDYFNIGKYKDPAAPKSHWGLMTRDVIEGSQSKNYSDQRALIAHYSQKTKIPYEVPTILDAVVCTFMEYVRAGNRLYPNSPLTFTRCQENYNAEWQLVIGGFSAAGLHVRSNFYDSEFNGVGSLRKF